MLRSPTKQSGQAGSLVLLALAIGAAPAHSDSALLFSIPGGQASQTIKEWSRQAGLQVLFDMETAQRYRTRGVASAFTPLDALGEMLRDTPLTFDVVNPRTVSVRFGTHVSRALL